VANSLSGKLQRLITKDKKDYLERTIKDASCLGVAKGLSAVQKALKPLVAHRLGRKSTLRPLPLLEDDSGRKATSKQDRSDFFAAHFASQELGVSTTLNDIANRAVARQNLRAASLGRLSVSSSDAVSILEYGDGVARANANGAVGLDALSLGLAKADERKYVRLTYPLILKQTLCLSEPVQAKGGELMALFKKGLAKKVSNYRSIMLSDAGQKAYHSAVRQKIVGRLEENGYRDQACSGRKGRGADFAALAARAFVRLLRRKKWSGCLFFWDLKAAYHRVVRAVIFGKPLYASDSEIAHLVQALGLPPGTMAALAARLESGDGIMAEAGLPWQLIKSAEEAHTSTFFLVSGAAGPYETHRGARPGSPFADIVHHFLLSRIMEQLEQKCCQENLLTELTWDGRRCLSLPDGPGDAKVDRVLELSVADDVVELIAVRKAKELPQRIASFAAATFQYFVEYGAEPNLEPGKTNVLPVFCGEGATEMRKELLIHSNGVVPFTYHGETHTVNCTTVYKHVGGIVCANGDMLPEAKAHIACLRSSVKAHEQVLTKNVHLDSPVKLAFLKSVGIVHLEWNCHVWPPLPEGVLKKLEVARSLAIRRILSLKSSAEKHITDERVDAEGGLSQEEAARICRLRFYVRLVQYAPSTLWAILRAASPGKGDWFYLIEADLDWLVANAPGEGVVSTVANYENLRDWASSVVALEPSKWRALVTRTCKRIQALKKLKYEWCAWDPFSAFAQRDNGCSGTGMLHCPTCDKGFDKAPAVVLHLYRVHGIKSKVREVINGSRCPACMTEFHTTNRYFVHLHDVPLCYTMVRKWWMADGCPARGDDGDSSPTAHRYGMAPERLPAYRVPGPWTLERVQAKHHVGKGKLSFQEQLDRYLGVDLATTVKTSGRRRLTFKQAEAPTEVCDPAGGRTPASMPDAKRRRLRAKQTVPRLPQPANAGTVPADQPQQDTLDAVARHLSSEDGDPACSPRSHNASASRFPVGAPASEIVANQPAGVEVNSVRPTSTRHVRQGVCDIGARLPVRSSYGQCFETPSPRCQSQDSEAMTSPSKKAKHHVSSDNAFSTPIGRSRQDVPDGSACQQGTAVAASFGISAPSQGRQGAGSSAGIRDGPSHETASPIKMPDVGTEEAARTPCPPCAPRYRIAKFRSKIILVVGKCPMMAAELRKRCGGGVAIVSWEGPFDRLFRLNAKETTGWALKVADGAVTALVWGSPACLGAFSGDCFRSASEPWGTRDTSPGGAGLLRVEALACNIGIEFMRCIADAGGTGVQFFRKSDNGFLRDHCVRRLGSVASVVGESVVLGQAPFPVNAAAGSDRASQQEAARAVLLRASSVSAARLSTEEEDLWHGTIVGGCSDCTGGNTQPTGRKRKPFALQIVEPASLCPDLDAARLRGEEAGDIPEVAEEHLDDDGPGDCWCGLDDDQQEDVRSDHDREMEVMHQLIERNRSAALARRRARQEKQLQDAVASATVTVLNEGGVVSHTRLVTLPGFATR